MKIIAESGSTKTDWRCIGETSKSFNTVGLNPYFVSSDEVYMAIKDSFASLGDEEITEVHFYGTGITDESKAEIIKHGIRKALKNRTEIFTYSDIIASARALFGNYEGLACILGTGSNSCYWDGQMNSFQIPPLGFWLGDEGSGGHLGKTLILDYLHKNLSEELNAKFISKYGTIDRLEILNQAYSQPKPNKYFASFAPFLLENKEDYQCQKLIIQSFDDFFAKYVLKYPNQSPIGFVGSIAHHFGDILTQVAASHNLIISKIVEKPIDALVEFHQE